MRAQAKDATLSGVVEQHPRRVWFGRSGFVERSGDDRYGVYVGGQLIGCFDDTDCAARDVLIALVADMDDMGREQVAIAFRVSLATVGRVVTRKRQGGLRAVVDTGRTGGLTKRTPKLLERVFALFDGGASIRGAHRVVAKHVSYGTVQTMHTQWLAARAASATAERDQSEPAQIALPLDAANDVEEADDESSVADDLLPLPSKPAGPIAIVIDEAVALAGGQLVQHVGAWIMLGALHDLGLYRIAERTRGDSVDAAALRVAIDAAATSLAIGEGCIEGVRRLETPTVDTLLRHRGGISASWTRRVLGTFAKHGATWLHAQLAAELLRRAVADDGRVWLYVDGHLRPYVGQEVVRKGWHMQSKRAVPGITDFYVHDEDGSPLWRVSVPSNDSLTARLKPVVDLVRMALPADVVPVLVFDRGGSYPATMAELRDMGAEFVTYEQKPYPQLVSTAFDRELTITLPSRPKKPIKLRYAEARDRNLGKGRGRVRRIAVLTESGKQLSVLATSTLPAETLIRRHLARWGVQENQFKHEVERWGLNQLDGRTVEEYPPDEIIPNPARVSLEHKLDLARGAEGDALRKLARLAADAPRRAGVEADLAAALARQAELEALRPHTPKRAAVRDTPLAGKLRRHALEYKSVVDSIRIALANVETDLALALTQHLQRPREAKKFLANLLAAPGLVRVGSRSISVRLAPPGAAHERAAYAAFLRELNTRRLTLPGDETSRPLRFGLVRRSDG